MSGADIANIFLIGFFAGAFLLAYFTTKNLQPESLRVPSHSNELIFRMSMNSRVVLIVIALYIVGPLIPSVQWVIDCLHRHRSIPVGEWIIFLCSFLLYGGFGVGLFYLSGPRDFYVNLDRRTYRFITGWPLSPRVRTGPFEDMVGVYVRRYQGRSVRVFFIVEIAWKGQGSDCPLLGRFGRESGANALADEMADLLSLPRVTRLPIGKTWLDPATHTLPKESNPPPFRPFQSTLFPESTMTEQKIDRK